METNTQYRIDAPGGFSITKVPIDPNPSGGFILVLLIAVVLAIALCGMAGTSEPVDPDPPYEVEVLSTELTAEVELLRTELTAMIDAGVTLSLWSEGDNVRNLQNALNYLNYYCGEADGVFGDTTNAQVLQFQTDYNLNADGYAGQATLTAILNALE